MASFTPKKFDLSTINSGKKFELGDGIAPEAINAPIEAAALLQSLATNPPDYSQAGNVGTPIVEIGGTEDAPKFVFKNIKGEKGDKGERGEKGAQGEQGIQGIQGEKGENGKDGHTTPAPNLLINGNFTINQRALFPSITTEATPPYYPIDRWLLIEGRADISPYSAKLYPNDDGRFRFRQFVELDATPPNDTQFFTLSLKYSLPVMAALYNYRVKVSRFDGDYVIYEDIFDKELLSIAGTATTISQNFSVSLSKKEYICVDIYSDNASGTEPLELNWVKLEAGKKGTGHFIRPYSEELALCQRYFFPISKRTVFAGIALSPRQINFNIPTSAMTHNFLGLATIYDTGKWIAGGNNGFITLEGYSGISTVSFDDSILATSIMCTITFSTSKPELFTRGASYNLYSNGNFFIDADIYDTGEATQ